MEDTLILAKSVSFMKKACGPSYFFFNMIYIYLSGVVFNLLPGQQKGCDVFSALDVMDNSSFLEHLKFSTDDASLHYYLYNWMCPKISPDKVTLHLLLLPPSFS